MGGVSTSTQSARHVPVKDVSCLSIYLGMEKVTYMLFSNYRILLYQKHPFSLRGYLRTLEWKGSAIKPKSKVLWGNSNNMH